jgi:two-component system KDP operon response regulator KdpE
MAGAKRLATVLAAAGFTCEIALWEQAPQRLLEVGPRLVVFDLPALDTASLAFCENVRGMFDEPIAICTASSREWDIVRAMDAGADEYLVMPMAPKEIRARLQALMRRLGDEEPASSNAREILAGDLRVSLDDHCVYRGGHPIDLSPIEFRLLLSLVRGSGRPVSYSKLLFSVWGPEYVNARHYLRLYVRYLRSKLEDDPGDPQIIVNEWGIGYRFRPKQG